MKETTMNATVRAVALFAKAALEQIAHLEKDPSAVLPDPSDPRQARALLMSWADLHTHFATRKERLLHVDDDAQVEIEAYIFSLNPSQFSRGSCLVFGEANGWTAHKHPQVTFLPEHLVVNVEVPGLVYLSVIQGTNINAEIGGISDAYTFSSLVKRKVPLSFVNVVHPWETMEVTGTWSTKVPPDAVAGSAFTMCLDFQGWGSMHAGDAETLERISKDKRPIEAPPEPDDR